MIVKLWTALIGATPLSVTRMVTTLVVEAWSRVGCQRKNVFVVVTGRVRTRVATLAPTGAPGSRLKLSASPFGSVAWSFKLNACSGRITTSGIKSGRGGWLVVKTVSVPLE